MIIKTFFIYHPKYNDISNSRFLNASLSTGNVAKFYLILRNVWDFDSEHLKKIYSTQFLTQRLKPVIEEFEVFFQTNGNLTPLDQVYSAEINAPHFVCNL